MSDFRAFQGHLVSLLRLLIMDILPDPQK